MPVVSSLFNALSVDDSESDSESDEQHEDPVQPVAPSDSSKPSYADMVRTSPSSVASAMHYVPRGGGGAWADYSSDEDEEG